MSVSDSDERRGRKSSGEDSEEMNREGCCTQGSARRLLFIGAASSLICAGAFGLLGALLAGYAGAEPALIAAAAFVAIAALCAGQVLFSRALRRVHAAFSALQSQLAKTLEAGDLHPLHIEDGRETSELVTLMNRLLRAAAEARESSAQYELANKIMVREKRRLRNALDSVGDGLVAIGPDQRVVFANRAAETFLSMPAKDATGKLLPECVNNPQLLAFLTEQDRDAAGTSDRMEISLNDQASHSAYCATVYAVADANKQLDGRCVLLQDVTSVKRAEKAREEFVNNVAHELRTPLTSMKAYVEMLIDGEATDRETQREFYNIIYQETDRLNRLINNLLNISRMELGTVVVNRTPTRLKKLIEDSISVVESQIAKRHLQLTVDLPDRLPAAEIDKDMMNVVLVNLLGNAVKYTPEDGHISVSSTSTQEEILVHITDTGVGVAEEDLPRIFDKFFRCTGTANTQEPGSGLGLYIARQIMRLHGGDIRVSSRLGEGSQFTIAIPRKALLTSLGDYEHDGTNDRGH